MIFFKLYLDFKSESIKLEFSYQYHLETLKN